MHLVARLLNLRGKWKIQKLHRKIKRLAARFHKVLAKLRSVSPEDMMPERLKRSFEGFNWEVKKVKADVTKHATVSAAVPAVRLPDWQKRWAKWGWMHEDEVPIKPKTQQSSGAATKLSTAPNTIVKHSCPGGEVVRRTKMGRQHVTSFDDAKLGGNFFNDQDWSLCFRAHLECQDVNSHWQVVFGGQCGQPIVGYVGGHWVFGRQCGGAPTVAFAKAVCNKTADVSVVKTANTFCFIVDGLQTMCKEIGGTKVQPYTANTKYSVGAGFHDGKEMFRGSIHWLRIGSASRKEVTSTAKALEHDEKVAQQTKANANCPRIQDVTPLTRKDFVADSNLQFESVAGPNCAVKSLACHDGVKVDKSYSYAGALFDPETFTLATNWAASPAFVASRGKDTSSFGNEPISITFTRNVNRVGFAVIGNGGIVTVSAYDGNNCRLGTTTAKFEGGAHADTNFVGLTGVGQITKVVIEAKGFSVDNVHFGNSNESKLKAVKLLELSQFRGDSIINFDHVAGAGCKTRTAACPEGVQVGRFYASKGAIFGEGTRNIATQWATSHGFAASNGPDSAFSDAPIVVYFPHGVERVGMSVLGVGDSVKVQLFDAMDNLIGATTVEYSKGRGQFVGIGGVGPISRIAIIGRGFAIDDLRFGTGPETPAATPEVVETIGGVRAWYSSDKDVTADAQGHVSLWKDRSPNGFDLQQTNAAMQPLLVPNGAGGGQPSVNFDGVSSLLTNEAFSSCTHKVTVFGVFRLETFAQHMGYPWALGDHNPGMMAQESEGSQTSFDMAFGHGNNKQFTVPLSNEFRVMTYAGASKTAMQVWANGKACSMGEFACCRGPAGFATPEMPCFHRLTLGGLNLAIPHPSRNTKVQWAEFIVFEKELTRIEREQVEEYLKKKYEVKPDPSVTTCASIKKNNANAASNFYDLNMVDGKTVKVYCDMTTDDGGWTRIQVIQNVLTTQGSVGDATYLKDIIGASDKEFRFSDNPNGAGTSNMYIKDDSPTMGQHALVAHTWTSTAPRVACKMAYNGMYKWTTDHKVSCDSTCIGVHQCGHGNGWIFWHNGNTYNFDGNHPCAEARNQATPFQRYLWVR